MKIVVLIILFNILLGVNILFAITIDGNAYLENQTDHSGIEVFLERTAPSSLTYTVYTNSSGYYTDDIETGFYNITFSKDNYDPESLNEQSLFVNTTLQDITLAEHLTLLNVPSDFATIQSAIDYAWTADTVLVDTGTYIENLDFIGKNITVASNYLTTQDTSYISQTIIDGNQNGVIVTFENGEDSTAILTGFTITNGFGGIICENSSPSLKNIIITSNIIGIYCYDYSSPNLENVMITCNSSVSDQALFGGLGCYNSSPSLLNVTIAGNSSENGVGGLYCENSSLSLLNVTIADNDGGEFGGLYCYNSNPNLENVMITGNSSVNTVGGLVCFDSNPSLLNVTIADNSSENGFGGLACSNSNPNLENVIITGNSSELSGGGILCDNSSPSLVNVTISGNVTNANGGGIYCSSSSPSLVNCIVSDNMGNYGIYVESGSPLITYSDFWNNDNGNFFNCETGIGVIVITNANEDSCDVYNNIQMNPCFLDTTIGDYHLTEISPCIDAGDPLSDYDPDGTIADMGAYYFDQSMQILPPNADFSADVTEGFSPLTVNYYDESQPGSSDIIQCKWYFGDGDSSSVQNPSHIYSSSGEFDVALTVTDENDSIDIETKVDYIIVYPSEPPASPSNLCIEIIGNDAILSWTAVDTTIYGNPISVDYYLVFYSEWAYPDSAFFFHGFTADTTYTHYAVLQFSDNMFYKIVSYIGSIERLNAFLEKKKTFIIQDMKNIWK